jgi:hypothetical protein
VARFEAAPVLVPLGVRLPPRATRRVPVPAPVPVLSSSVSAAATLVFPRRAVLPTVGPGPSSAGASCVTLVAFLDLVPTRRLVVVGAGAGAGAGATSTDWLRVLVPRRRLPFAGSASGPSGSRVAPAVALAFVPRVVVLRVGLLGSAGSLSVVVDSVDFVADFLRLARQLGGRRSHILGSWRVSTELDLGEMPKRYKIYLLRFTLSSPTCSLHGRALWRLRTRLHRLGRRNI